MKLSKRLQKVADLIPMRAKIADIGSDHAYLPTYLVEQGKAVKAVAGEVNQGPYETAKRTVEEAGLSDKIDVRRGNGLEVITAGEADTITVCGMGGGTIVEILAAGKDKLYGVKKMILQPMVDSDRLRKWLHQNGWRITVEELVMDEGILYEILLAEPGQEVYSDPLWYEFGNVELLKNHPLFPQKIACAIEKLERILRSLQKAQGEDAGMKRDAMLEKKNRLEEVWKACKQESGM